MFNCGECDIEKKLEYCCRNHPITEESREIVIDSASYRSCPNLDGEGKCKIYEKRPEACVVFDCVSSDLDAVL